MKPLYYRLDGQTPVPCRDVREWMQYCESMFGNDANRVGLDLIEDIEISTVFLGLDYNFKPFGPPLLFETIVFHLDPISHPETIRMQRYSTWAEAEAGHRAHVAKIRDSHQHAEDHAASLLGHLLDQSLLPRE